MVLRNKTYSAYYLEEIDNWGDRRNAVSKFGDKIHDNYHFLFPDDQDLSTTLFGKDKLTAIVAEFDLSKHISGHGPTGEIIINEPIAEVPERIFEEFLNLVDPNTNIIFDESILNFTEKYGLLFFNPNDELIDAKYHIEDLSIWKQEISLMHSLTKLYYYYDLAGYDLTKNAGLKGLESLFIKKNGKQYYFDDSYKSLHKGSKEIKVSINGIDEFKNDKNLTRISYEQLIVKLIISVLKPRLENSTNSNLKEIYLQKKYQPRDYVWFNFEKDYTSLYSFIWTQFGNFIQNKGTFKICSKCKRYFVSKVIQRGRFCSDKCRASTGREKEVWELVSNQFKTKGYETYLTAEKQYSRLNLSLRADATLYNQKTKKMVALLEFKYSEVDNESPKFKFIDRNIMKALNLYKKYFELNHAFVVNKNKKIFFWDLDKKIYGKEIKGIPYVTELKESTLEVDKKIEKKYYEKFIEEEHKKKIITELKKLKK